MDTKTQLISEHQGPNFYLAQFKAADLSIFTYYLESKGESILIDPTINTNEFRELIAKRSSKLSLVVCTHYHSDFVGGHGRF